MNRPTNPSRLAAIVLLAICCSSPPVQVRCLQAGQQQQMMPQQPNVVDYQQNNYPYYMASPISELEAQQNQLQGFGDASSSGSAQQHQQQINQRSLKQQKLIPSSRKMNLPDIQPVDPNQIIVSAQAQVKQTQQQQPQQQQQQPPPQQQQQPPPPLPLPPQLKDTCLYDKQYFGKLDECLARRPFPTVGLLAFKNEDLLVHKESQDRHGCVFVLNNGLFKNYQISRYFVDSEEQCLDNSKVSISMSFANVTLSYLWTLRCLNRADQLLDDATMSGRTVDPAGAGDHEKQQASICVGSSQNFGFASLQLTNVDAQIDLVTDIYKNWRVTNITVAMNNPGQSTLNSTSRSGAFTSEHSADPMDMSVLLGTSIKSYVFETLDGDELNWRYLHMFQNWSRNKMHANFLAQYKRFLWISLQRCLAESSEKLPTKLMDIFTNQKFS